MIKAKSKKLRKKCHDISRPEPISEEVLARDWTLSPSDKTLVLNYTKSYRLAFAIQLCAMKLYGRFIHPIDNVSVSVLNYLSAQLGLPPSFSVCLPKREATWIAHQHSIYQHLQFKKFGPDEKAQLLDWVSCQSAKPLTPKEMIPLAEQFLLDHNIALPGASVLRRLVVTRLLAHQKNLFDKLYCQLSPSLIIQLNNCLKIPKDSSISFFAKLKEYSPHSSTISIRYYLSKYRALCQINMSKLNLTMFDRKTINYFAQLAKRYHADDMKRFAIKKRMMLLVCFLVEAKKQLLDYIVALHEQFIGNMLRRAKNSYQDALMDKQKKAKQAHDVLLTAMEFVMNQQEMLHLHQLYQVVDERCLKNSIKDSHTLKQLDEYGFIHALVARYTNLRQYLPDFLQLPFASEKGSEALLRAIKMIRKLNEKRLRHLPDSAPCEFMPPFMQKALSSLPKLRRKIWEIGLAIAIRDALRSGDLYLPDSKQYVSFVDLIYDDKAWETEKAKHYHLLDLPKMKGAILHIKHEYLKTVKTANTHFPNDPFASIQHKQLQLTKDDKLDDLPKLKLLHKTIEGSLPKIRIEQLLMEVDKATQFSECFVPISHHNARPPHFYRTLMAAIIAHATNLGTLTMANSTPDMTVDQLRQ